MADFSLCPSTTCPARASCRRSPDSGTAPSQWSQSWSIFEWIEPRRGEIDREPERVAPVRSREVVMPAPLARLHTSVELATILGARFVEAMPDDIRPGHVRRFWRCAVDKLHPTAPTSILVLCRGGDVMAWRVDPEAYTEDHDDR